MVQEKHIDITPAAPESYDKEIKDDFKDAYMDLAGDLNVCSQTVVCLNALTPPSAQAQS